MRHVRRHAPPVLVAVAALVVACGGAAPSDLFGGGAAARGGDATAGGGDLDAGRPARDGAPAGDDRARAPAAAGIACLDAVCALGVEVCCSRGEVTACASAKGCSGGPQKPLALPCDDADDCTALGEPRTVCCGDYETDGEQRPHVVKVTCVAPKECLERQRRVVLCGDGDEAQCPAGTRCEVSQVAIPGFRMCVRASG